VATPALKLKTHWFKGETPRSPAENASALAFITFRVAVQMLKRMRDARFEIDAGPTYFAFVREVLVFLVAVVDRMAHARLEPAERQAFTTAMVLRVADFLHDNEADLLGSVPDEAGQRHFVDLFNELVGHYAEFGWTPEQGPDFGFLRYLGHRLEAVLPLPDRHWVVDQVISIEAPEAVSLVQRGMDGVFSTAPRRARRAAMTGE
jgi:hypothetical protein